MSNSIVGRDVEPLPAALATGPQATGAGGAALLRQMLSSLPVPAWTAQADGGCDHLNAQWLRYTGVPPERQLGWGWTALLHPADCDITIGMLRAAAAAHTDYVTEWRLRGDDGVYRWFKAHGRLWRDEAGRPCWICTCTDIDDLRRTAAELTEERDRLLKVAAAVPGAIHTARMDPQGQFSFVFGAEPVGRLVGLPPELLAAPVSAFRLIVHPEDDEPVRARVQHSAATMTALHSEFRIRHPMLGERWIEVHALPERDADGSFLWHGELSDVTERKLAEQAVEESRLQLETAFDILSEGVVLCAPDGVLYRWNDAALAMHGFTAAEEAHRPLGDFRQLFQLYDLEGREMAWEEWPLVRVLRNEPFDHLELRVRHRVQGWEKVFDYGGSLVRDPRGQTVMALVHMSDITRRYEQDTQVRQLNAQLELRVRERTAALQAAVEEMEAFSYSVSHDLRAPLRAMDGFTQRLLQDCAGQLGGEPARYLQYIRDSSRKMGQLIDDLLAFSRISSTPVKLLEVDPNPLLREALAQLGPATAGRRIDLRLDPLPPCRGDPALLRQVWINLLSNAFKYTRPRDPAVVEVGSLRDEAGRTTYFVRDNGVGFDMRYVHKLFGVFERLHAQSEFEGTGVGLAIVQRIVRRHGGEIRAEGEPGRGARFYFHLGN